MKKALFLFAVLLVCLTPSSYAQSGANTTDITTTGVLIILGLLVLTSIYLIGNHLVQIQAINLGMDTDEEPQNTGIRNSKPSFIPAGDSFKVLKKGLDINLKGKAPKEYIDRRINTVALQPMNYRGIRPIPKLLVETGQQVEAGEPIFFDKDRPGINFVSPVSGEVISVNRGEKRAITEIVILKDKEQKFKSLDAPNISIDQKDSIYDFLKENGAIPLFIERPFGIVPQVDELPDRIHISSFDSSPLAPDLGYIIANRLEDLQKGIDVLQCLCPDEVHLGLDADITDNPFSSLSNCTKHWFKGPHPAGNVGIQIHNIRPQGLNEKIWTIDIQNLVTLGKMFSKGIYDATRILAITGTGTNTTGYISTYPGANIADLLALDKGVEMSDIRIISGNVLTGEKKELTNFVNSFDHQITLIPEGNYHELLGWLLPQSLRPTASHTFLGGIVPDLEFDVDTNTHGEQRAFVVTGQYESVLPVDTYPQQLFKAILAQDFEKMQGLGIHELLEEDVALCEFVCTSKQNVQSILRQGLDYMRAQV